MLKIDLLPKHFAVAARNKKLVVLLAVLLVAVGGALFYWKTDLENKTAKAIADTEALKPIVAAVDNYTAETSKLESGPAEATLWKQQLQFVKDADALGPKYWKAFHKINEYIWEGARMTSFSLTPPSTVSFTVEVRGTRGAGKFLMNILRCPAITGITMNGLPAGAGATAEGVLPSGAALPAMAAPGGGGPGGPPPGAPPMGPPGAMPGAMPGAVPGAPGAAPAPSGGPPSGPPGSPTELITLTINATLTGEYTITVPSPPGGAGAAPAGGGPPGGAPGAPPGGDAGAPPSPPGGGEGGGGLGKNADAGGGME